MRRVFGAIVMMVAAVSATPASAQTAAPAMPSGPIVNSWYVGVNGGSAVVEKFGGAFGAEGGLRVWRNLDLIGELAAAQNIVSRRQLDRVGTLAQAVQDSTGSSASGNLKVPMRYGGLGARWVFEQSGTFRPYVLFTAGGAHTERKPTLTLAGADITGSAAQYGLTLGQDVIGKYNEFATEGGIGIVVGVGTWYFDAGARLLSISGDDQRTNVARLVFGGGYRF